MVVQDPRPEGLLLDYLMIILFIVFAGVIVCAAHSEPVDCERDAGSYLMELDEWAEES